MSKLYIVAMVDEKKVPLLTKAIEVVAGFTPIVEQSGEMGQIYVGMDGDDKITGPMIDRAMVVIQTLVWLTDEYDVKEKQCPAQSS